MVELPQAPLKIYYLVWSLMTFHRLSILLSLIFLEACSSPFRVNPEDVLVVSENVEVERDPFRGVLTYQGPVVTNRAEDGTDHPEVEDIYLRSQIDRSRPMRYFLVVSDYYDGDWRGFNQAFDIEGRKFHALSVRHKVNCKLICGYEETLDIEVDRDYLESHLEKGLNMRLYGPSGQASAAFTLPGAYIHGFLKGAYVE